MSRDTSSKSSGDATELEPEASLASVSVARVFDHMLGGMHNFAADRDLASVILQIAPNAQRAAVQSRHFLQRAVRFMLHRGVRQFVDLGSGLPVQGNVHEIVKEAGFEGKVVYVDPDPVVAAHSRALLSEEKNTLFIESHIQSSQLVLNEASKLVDLTQPVGLLILDTLERFSTMSDAQATINAYTQRMKPGGYIAISHITEDFDPTLASNLSRILRETHARTRKQVFSLLRGLAITEPGVVPVSRWNNDEDTGFPPVPIYAAVAQLPSKNRPAANAGSKHLIRLPGPNETYFYPSFQYDTDGEPRGVVVAVNAILHAHRDPVGVAGWWNNRNAWLGDRPVDILDSGRDEELIEAARAVGWE